VTIEYSRLGKKNKTRTVGLITALIAVRSAKIKSFSISKSDCQIDSIHIMESRELHRRVTAFIAHVSWTTSGENTIHDNQIKTRMTFSTTVHFVWMLAMLEHDVLLTKSMFEGGVNPLNGSPTNLVIAKRRWCW
jgi:hypothetical protein